MSLEEEINEMLRDADDRERGGATRLSEGQLPAGTIAKIEALERAVRMLAKELDKFRT
jgi:hypothetical protein